MKCFEIDEMVNNSDTISGIYNYCDQWCQRCSFTARCTNFLYEKEFSGELKYHDFNNKVFWEKILQFREDALDKLAKKLQTHMEFHFYGEQKSRKHSKVSELALVYITKVHHWLKDNGCLFKEEKADLEFQLHFGDRDLQSHKTFQFALDAVSVIRWYQYQIYAKFMRALYCISSSDEFNGYAKVVLLAVDRSIGAWEVLRNYLPKQKNDDIIAILLHLDHIRRKIEFLFPDARAFILPGFDEN